MSRRAGLYRWFLLRGETVINAFPTGEQGHDAAKSSDHTHESTEQES